MFYQLFIIFMIIRTIIILTRPSFVSPVTKPKQFVYVVLVDSSFELDLSCLEDHHSRTISILNYS